MSSTAEKYGTVDYRSETGVELTNISDMQRSSSVQPTDWGNSDNSARVGEGKSDKQGMSLYWFTGVPEHLKLSKSLTKQELRQINVMAADNHVSRNGIDPADFEEKELLNMKTVLAGFVDFTTSHGITHIYKTRGIIKRIVWAILSLTSLALLGYHLWYVLTNWLANSTTTNVVITDKRSLPFPAVTICNNNPIKSSAIEQSLWDVVSSKRQGVRNGSQVTISNNKIYDRLTEQVSYFSVERKENMGYRLREMFLYCTYNGENCVFEEDFWSFYNPTYGNCYTFNSGKVENVSTKHSSNAGQQFGLSLIINLDTSEYLPFLTEEAGVRVLLHDQSNMPFPATDSIMASPGLTTNIAARKVEITRLSGRYGNCTDTAKANPVDNMFATEFKTSYSEPACLKTCYQRELVKMCGCYDPDYPYDFSYSSFSDLAEAAGPCRLDSVAEQTCEDGIEADFASEIVSCNNCTKQCHEVRYDYRISNALFPVASYMEDFIARFSTTDPVAYATFASANNVDGVNNTIENAIRSNIVKLNVFYERLEYTHYESQISYPDFQFFSDLGGIFGLWVGWSILTFFEIVELVIDLFAYCCYKACNKKKN